MIELFFKTSMLGFFIAVPVGPIGVLCINNSLNNGYKTGIVTGLGAASADVFFASIVAFGLFYIRNALMQYQGFIQFGGMLLLCYLGFKTFFSKSDIKCDKKIRLTKTFFISFILTLTNPMTIIAFLALYSSLGFVNYNTTLFSSLFFVLGIFVGSNLWWIILSSGVSFFKEKLQKKLNFINKISGIVILSFAAWILIKLILDQKKIF